MSRVATLVLVLVVLVLSPQTADAADLFSDVRLLRVGAVATENDCGVDRQNYEELGVACFGRRYPRADWPIAIALRCKQQVVGITVRVTTDGKVRYRGKRRVVKLADNEQLTGEFDVAGDSSKIGAPRCAAPVDDARRQSDVLPETLAVPSVNSGAGVAEAWYDIGKRLKRVRVTIFAYSYEDGSKTATESFSLRIPRDGWTRQCFADAATPARVLANPDSSNQPPAPRAFVQPFLNEHGSVKLWPGGVDQQRAGRGIHIDAPDEALAFTYFLDGREIERWPARVAPSTEFGSDEEYRQTLALYPGAIVRVPSGVHTLTVRAADSRGGVAEQSVRVRCESTRRKGWPLPPRPGGYRPS